MPKYVLFHNGRPCTLQLKGVTPKDDGQADFELERALTPKPKPCSRLFGISGALSMLR